MNWLMSLDLWDASLEEVAAVSKQGHSVYLGRITEMKNTFTLLFFANSRYPNKDAYWSESTFDLVIWFHSNAGSH